MKRTASQAAFPSKWEAAKRRRLASRAQSAAVTRIIRNRADKRVATFANLVGVSSSGQIDNLLTNLARGDQTVNNFSGEFMSWQWVRLRWIASAGTNEIDTCRVILFQWDDSVPPTVGNVLDLTSGPNPTIANYNFRNRRILRVLYDSNSTVHDGDWTQEISKKIFVSGSKLTKSWFATSASAAIKGGLYCLRVSDSTVAPNPTIELNFEGCFTDEI